MLDQIQKLAKTITPEQAESLQVKLGDAYPSFHLLMASDTEESVAGHLAEFKSKVKKIPMLQLLALHRELTDEQRAILEDLL